MVALYALDFRSINLRIISCWVETINNICVGLVGLQAAIMEPQICKGIILLNISLRMLHITKQPWYGRPLIRTFQNILRYVRISSWSPTHVIFVILELKDVMCCQKYCIGKNLFQICCHVRFCEEYPLSGIVTYIG